MRTLPRPTLAGSVRSSHTAQPADQGYAWEDEAGPLGSSTEAFPGAFRLARGRRRGLGLETRSNSPTADADSGGKREFRLQRTAPATF
jgi:hypothetical protein